MKSALFPLIGGLPGVVLDGGMHKLAAKIETGSNISAPVFPWFRWKEARSQMIAAAKEGRLIGVGGHSYGCMESGKISLDMDRLGLHIPYIAGIDPTATPMGYGPIIIGKNVEYVDEFWASLGWPAVARLRSSSGARGGKFTYPHGTDNRLRKYTTGHIALGSNSTVHDIIAAHVRVVAESLK